MSKFYEAIETAGPAELAALQLQRLKNTLAHAWRNVAPLRRKFEQAGVRPEDLDTLADLGRFPFSTKGDLREAYPFGLFAVPREKIVRIHASSGTTGKPTVVGYTQADLDLWAGIMARTIHAAGGRPGDLVHNAYGYGLFTGGLGFHCGAERLGCTVIPMSGGQTEKQVQLISDFRPRIICCTPSYLLTLADGFAEQGIDPASSSLRLALAGGEPCTREMRAAIETRLRLDVVESYGLSEVIGPGVAAECIEARDGLTVWEDHFYPEIIDPSTGEVLPDGKFGELVLTTLTKEALPMIRYRTRDLTRLLPGTARPMRRLDKFAGRSDDMLIIRGVNVFPSQIEELILKSPALAPHYLIEVTRPQHLDEIEVQVEMTPEADNDTARIHAAAELRHRIKSYIGISARVRVMPVASIERPVGKARRVVDRRAK
ncbi:MAG: Phenylacetate-coenzyme A ligase [Rhodocyclaceae bacterium]|nr:MAG: phenylacetate--CoA ligase [Rhodocyclaceae bacterium]MBV6407112.1 Phenylacetate-coenzyme A ligase [Rhodocyclaceae bacterium]CAG0926616.1 phenylacetate-CoA ligase [Rhodocyclaceae bacterium]